MMNDIDSQLSTVLPYVVEVSTTVNKPFKKNGKYTKQVESWYLDSSKSSYEAYDREEEREVWGPFSRVLFRKVNLDSRNELVAFLLEAGWEPEEYNFKEEKENLVQKSILTQYFVEGIRPMHIKTNHSNPRIVIKRFRAEIRDFICDLEG